MTLWWEPDWEPDKQLGRLYARILGRVEASRIMDALVYAVEVSVWQTLF